MNQAPIKFRFLQFSDVLLDSKLTHTGTSPGGLITGNPALPKHERQERAREILEATINAFSLAQSEKVDAILIPGGLWDNVTVTGYTVNTVIEAASAIQDIPIFIAPGHRDFYTRSSLYSNDMLQARGLKSWPANVHIFSHEHFTCVPHPHREEIAFIGRACSKNSRRTERILSGHLPRNPKASLHIALFAGTLETHPSHLASQANQQSAKRPPIYPFSEQELADEGLTYAAVGHLREAYQIILPHENDRLIGAYSGCLAGGTFEELGTRFAITGEINLDRQGQTSIELTPQELDNRRMMLVTVDVSGLGEEDIAAEVIIAMEESEVRPDSDVVCVNLEGRHKPSVDAKSVVENLAADFYYLQVCDNTRPDYLADRMDERTTEWKYIESMLDMKAKVERNKNVPLGTDSLSGIPGMDLSGKTIEDALYYGLDALKQKKVTIKNVG